MSGEWITGGDASTPAWSEGHAAGGEGCPPRRRRWAAWQAPPHPDRCVLSAQTNTASTAGPATARRQQGPYRPIGRYGLSISIPHRSVQGESSQPSTQTSTAELGEMAQQRATPSALGISQLDAVPDHQVGTFAPARKGAGVRPAPGFRIPPMPATSPKATPRTVRGTRVRNGPGAGSPSERRRR